MLPPLFRIEPILQACQDNHLILTPNQRLRSKAIQAWGIYQQSLGKDVWQAPRILTLEQWFDECWKKLQSLTYPDSNTLIATPEQERVLWEKVTADCGLMQPEVLAKQAASGLQILEKWELGLDSLKEYSADSGIDTYLEWCSTFHTHLKKQGMICREKSYAIIGNAFEKSVLSVEENIHLVGFDDIPPLINTQLNKATNTLTHSNLHDYQPESLVRVNYNDTELEMAAAAEWAKSIIEKQSAEEGSPVRIGIIVPNLGQCRNLIERALINSFEGHSLLAETPRYTLPFNISAGIPLGNTPLISDTLKILKLSQHYWKVDQLCQLLFSPFWGKLSEEIKQRCQLVDWLQAKGVFDIGLSELRYQMEKIAEEDTCLFRYFSTIHQYQLENKGAKLPSDWVTFFLHQLDTMHWPGERQPDSHEYQQTQLWYRLLERFSGLDSTLGLITISSALQQLQQMANHQPFQAQVPDSPIQVLGILEGAGLHFTHCWVMGLHQNNWPPAPSPNTLLPVQLQRKHNMPHATSLRELTFAESLTQHYRHCAKHIIFSSPEYETDSEQALLVSTLIQDIPLSSLEISGQSHDFSHYLSKVFQSRQIEWVDCSSAPAVSASEMGEHSELKGGASVVKAQSINPFDAFSIYRLKAKGPLPPVMGFSPIEQGNILHQVLATVWDQIKQHSSLIAIATDTLFTLVHDNVSAEVKRCRNRKYQHLGEALCQIEIERQTSLILKWLEFEKARPPFTVVSIEDNCELVINGIKLQLRMDRVDQLEDGSYLILDYKTGTNTSNDWQGERPKEPQLPLYLLAHQIPVSGIAFAQINVRKQTLVGLQNGEHPTPGLSAIGDNRSGLPETWEAAKENWQQSIELLLQNYLSGNTIVDYRDKSSINHYKALLPLNRYYDKERLKSVIKSPTSPLL
ncbi:MAG: PD-(D/E)XK nuclease family protein [Cellvibrionaceae bacterium]